MGYKAISREFLLKRGYCCDNNCKNCPYRHNNIEIRKKAMKHIKMRTNKGEMIVELYTQDTPKTVANFIKLANEGFYDGLKFHRVISNFMVQGGCPDGNGMGGPGYTIQCEHQVATFSSQQHDRGVLSMAHAGPNTGGSQFFICHNRQGTQHLDGRHTCFGKIVEGIEVLDHLRGEDTFSIEVME